jgi:hypothetical protein
MKSQSLVPLPSFSYTQLDFDTIITDVQNLVLEHPEYLENWDDFTESDAGKMLIEMLSFIAEKFSSKLDWVAREIFLSTATQKQSQIDILSLINYKPKPPKAAKVNATLDLTKWVESFNLPARLTISAPDTNGNMVSFECIEMADDGKPNYSYIHSIDTGTELNKIKTILNVPFYQGATIVENDIWMDGISNETVNLSNYPVVYNTIRIESMTSGREFIEVQSFISPEAQQQDVPDNLKTIPYMIKYDATNAAKVIFGHSSIVSIPAKNERIKMTYRTGGGRTTNIVAGALNQTRAFVVGSERVTGIFTNPLAGFEGADAESIDEARLTAPLSLRTANKTVTNEDYIIHLEEVANVNHAYIVSAENEPDEIYNDFGYSLPPLDTWIYISPKREGANTADPLKYQTMLQLSENFVRHGWDDYEDFVFDSNHQTVILSKLRKFKYHTKVVTLIDNATGLAQNSYSEDIDFSFNYVKGEITRISTADGGTIPSDAHTLRILYTTETSVATFKTACVKTITSGYALIGSSVFTVLYPALPIKIFNYDLSVEYVRDVDYTFDYNTRKVTIIPGGRLAEGANIICSYADSYDSTAETESSLILKAIKDKKMLCVDNSIKQSRYGVFDIVAKVYCYKNLKGNVEAGLPEHIKSQFTIDMSLYNYPINKSEIYAMIMNYPGVRFVEIEYLGRDYSAYYRYILGDIDAATLTAMDADKVEHKIQPKYNEILVLAQDEWDGVELNDNKRHGVILNIVEG